MGGGGGGGGAVNIEMLGRPVIDDVPKRRQVSDDDDGRMRMPRPFVTSHGAGPSRLPQAQRTSGFARLHPKTAAEIHT
jgi:hypothetical protein